MEKRNFNFIGNYKHNIDEKGRLAIPSKLRKLLSDKIYISLDFDGALAIRTVEDFYTWRDTLLSKGNFSIDSRRVSRAILGNSFELEIDSQGRILLPDILVKESKIKKEVYLVGTGDKLEIFAAETWNNFMKTTGSGILEMSAEKLSEK